jgi:hypothetical protein
MQKKYLQIIKPPEIQVVLFVFGKYFFVGIKYPVLCLAIEV